MIAKFNTIISDRKISIALALIGLLLSVGFSLWSPSVRYSEYSWSPARGDTNGRFQLSRSWPQRFQLNSDCQKIRNVGDGLIFSSGGLVLEKIGESITLRSTENSEIN